MIATTNRPELVDVAFRRRFDIWVEFVDPSEKERAELWRLLFPPQAPIDKGGWVREAPHGGGGRGSRCGGQLLTRRLSLLAAGAVSGLQA